MSDDGADDVRVVRRNMMECEAGERRDSISVIGHVWLYKSRPSTQSPVNMSNDECKQNKQAKQPNQ